MVLTKQEADKLRGEALQTWENRRDIADRYGVTLSNVYRVLSNKAHPDPGYNPAKLARQVRPEPRKSTPWSVVDDIRKLRQQVYLPHEAVAQKFGVTENTVASILKNTTRVDPEFDPSSIRGRDDLYLRETRINGFIYGLYCVCDNCKEDQGRVRYVGQTVQNPEKRLSSHRKPYGSDKYTIKSKWVSEHGPANIRVVTLETDPPEGLDEAEMKWIDKMNTLAPAGLNMTPGGYAGAGKPGSDNNSAKLTEAQVKEVINLLEVPGATSRGIAAEFGVTKTLILKIDHGDLWPHIDRPNGTHRLNRNRKMKLNPDSVRAIRYRISNGEDPKRVAEEFGVEARDIMNAYKRITWKDVE